MIPRCLHIQQKIDLVDLCAHDLRFLTVLLLVIMQVNRHQSFKQTYSHKPSHNKRHASINILTPQDIICIQNLKKKLCHFRILFHFSGSLRDVFCFPLSSWWKYWRAECQIVSCVSSVRREFWWMGAFVHEMDWFIWISKPSLRVVVLLFQHAPDTGKYSTKAWVTDRFIHETLILMQGKESVRLLMCFSICVCESSLKLTLCIVTNDDGAVFAQDQLSGDAVTRCLDAGRRLWPLIISWSCSAESMFTILRGDS